MSWYNDGRLHFGVGIEDTFIPQEGVGRRKLDEYELTQHYHRWREDLKLAADSGATLIRWGVPWYLLEPVDGQFDFGWLDQVIPTFSELGLEVVLDLMHYGTPLWLENSFLNPQYPELVARYAGAITQRYPQIKAITPLNEPMVNAIWCGRDGRWPPYLHGHSGFVAVLMQLAAGMVRTQQEIARLRPDMTFVHVDAGFIFEENGPGGLSLADGNEWRFLALDLITGRVDAEHPLFSYLLEHGACQADLDWLRRNAITPDVLGINYYPAFTKQRVTGDGAESPVWAGAEGLVAFATAYYRRYELPLAITETSLATDDVVAKTAWVDAMIDTVSRLRSDGVPIVATFWFPMLDLYDWSYREGTEPADYYLMRFGLVDLQRGPDNVLHRVPNAAFGRWQERVRAEADSQ